MSIVRGQDFGMNNYASTWSQQFYYPTPAGSFVAIFMTVLSATANITSITDNLGNTYRPAAAPTRGIGGAAISTQIWYAYNLNPSYGYFSHTITVVTDTLALWYGDAIEFTGVGSAFDPLDRVSGNAVASMAAPYDFTCGSVTPRTDGALVVAVTVHVVMLTQDSATPSLTFIAGEFGSSRFTYRYGVQTTATPETGAISWDQTSDVCASMATFLAVPYTPWVDVPNFHEEPINAADYPGGIARCVCDLWSTASGVTMKARLVSLLADGSIDAEVGRSADVTSQVPVDATFAITLTGNKQHKLQLTGPAKTGLWCSPDAKVVA
jgi:hypothetical protein